MTRTDELLLSQATHGSQPAESWWCAQCQKETTLDTHGRCGTCASEAVTCRVYKPEPKRDARTAFAKHLYSLLEQF